MKVLLFVVALLLNVIHAQGPWPFGPKDSQVGISIQKPLLDDNDFYEYTFFTLSYLIYGNFKIGDRASIKFDLPISHAGIEAQSSFGDFDDSETSIGNPGAFLSLRLIPVLYLDAGVRLPLSDQENGMSAGIGAISHIQDMFRAFPEAFPFYGIFTVHTPLGQSSPVFFQGGAGPVWAINTDQDEGEDGSDLFLKYCLSFGVLQSNFEGQLGWNSLGILTESMGADEDRFLNSIFLDASIKLPPTSKFAFTLDIPLNSDFRDVVSAVIGLRYSFLFPN